MAWGSTVASKGHKGKNTFRNTTMKQENNTMIYDSIFFFFYKYLLKVYYLSHSVLHIWNKKVSNTELITALKEFKNQRKGQTGNYNREC